VEALLKGLAAFLAQGLFDLLRLRQPLNFSCLVFELFLLVHKITGHFQSILLELGVLLLQRVGCLFPLLTF
jgi:hypothetical protein